MNAKIPGFLLIAAERLAQVQGCAARIEPAGETFRILGRHDRRREPLAAMVYPSGEVDYFDGELINGELPNTAWARRYAPELLA